MKPYPPSEFAVAAARLPQGLAGAVHADLGESTTQYLSDAAAAADGAGVVAALKADGVRITAARMQGTSLVVTVPSRSDVAAVAATGAVAQVGTSAPDPYSDLRVRAASAVLGGEPYGYATGPTSAEACSIGFNGYALPGGASEFATAGHCMEGQTGATTVQEITESAPGLSGAVTFGATIGASVPSSFEFGSGYDTGLIQVSNSALTPAPAITTWGGGQGSPQSGQLAVTGETPAIVGAPICKSGARTGWTCGSVLAVDQEVDVMDDAGDDHTVNGIVTSVCVLPGDSGGAAVIGTLAAGTVTGSSWTGSCTSPAGGESVFFPMVSAANAPSITSHAGSSWELSVSVPTPAVSSGSAIFVGSPLTGTVPGGSTGETVHVYLNGSTTAIDAAVDASGSWSVPLTSAHVGQNSYSLQATFGSLSSSATTSGTVTLVPVPTVSRVSGSDRYATADALADADFPGTAATVFVATGTNYPDALSAAPAAAADHAPLLLTPPGALPAQVEAEIARLSPTRIVVVGGPSAVSDAVVGQLASYAPVTRVYGSDRYATSRAVAQDYLSHPQAVFVATGLDFPDALSAGAAAGAGDDPVILVPGTSGALDSTTTAAISGLHPSKIYVIGGTAAITGAIATDLADIAPVTRLSGSDRYGTSSAVGQLFPSASTAYLASGADFPDALVGAVAAGSADEPLYLAEPTCIPDSDVSELGRLRAGGIILLGGTSALSTGVSALGIC
jgi:putative cell wall-binding protein